MKPRLSRGKGASVARAVSYLAREKIEDERTGETFDFSHHKDRALWSGVYAPKDAPEWAKDLQSLVTEIERAEKRKDAQLALPIELSLAHELTPEQNRWMLQDFIKENFTRQGYATIAAIHEPPSHGDERNIHAHLLVTLRKLDEEGFSKTKHEQQGNFLARSERVETLRQSWEKHLKHHLERHGFEREAKAVSCKSLEAQGIDREPTRHLGPVAAHLERAGEQSERGDINRDIEELNKERERLRIEARAVGREFTDAELDRLAARPYQPLREDREEERKARQQVYDARMLELRRIEVGRIQGEIRLSYTLAPSGEAFASALEEKGLLLTRATAADVERNERAQRLAEHVQGAYSPKTLKEGEYYVVSGGGYVYALNIQTTGASKAEIIKRLGPLDQESLLNVGDAQAVMREVRENRKEERDKAAKVREAREKTAAELAGSGGLGMVSQQQAAQRRFERAQDRAAAQVRPLPPEEARARTEAERQRRDEERGAAAQEITAPPSREDEERQKRQEAKRQMQEAARQAQEAARQEQQKRDAARAPQENPRREQEEKNRREQEERKAREPSNSFAGRKDHGQQKQEERTARTEQTEAQRREHQKNIMKELFERRFGKGHNENSRENWERERER